MPNTLQDETGILISAITLALEWHDEYLKWDDIPYIDYYKQFSVQMPKGNLWTPEITVWNSAGETMNLKMKNDSIMRVSSEGEVSGQISSLVDTECEMQLLKYGLLKCLDISVSGIYTAPRPPTRDDPRQAWVNDPKPTPKILLCPEVYKMTKFLED